MRLNLSAKEFLALHDVLQLVLDMKGVATQDVHNIYSRMRTVLVASLTKDEHAKDETTEAREKEAFDRWAEGQKKKFEILSNQNNEIVEGTKTFLTKDPWFLTLKADELKEYDEEVKYPRKGGTRPPHPTMPSVGKHHLKKR